MWVERRHYMYQEFNSRKQNFQPKNGKLAEKNKILVMKDFNIIIRLKLEYKDFYQAEKTSLSL